MTAATLNGQPRWQLSDQLDRLDTILDALAEALPGAVADACRDGARAAVAEALVELASRPEVRALFAPARPGPAGDPPAARGPGLWARLKARAAAAAARPVAAVRRAVRTVSARYRAAAGAVAAVGAISRAGLPARRVLAVGLGTGLVVRVAGLVVPQAVAAAVGAAGAAATAVAVQGGLWLARAARRLGLTG